MLSNAVNFLDKEAGTIRLDVEAAIGEHISASAATDPALRRSTGDRSSPRSGACSSIGTSPDQAWAYFVKTFVEEQGGGVWVESRVGEGTEF